MCSENSNFEKWYQDWTIQLIECSILKHYFELQTIYDHYKLVNISWIAYLWKAKLIEYLLGKPYFKFKIIESFSSSLTRPKKLCIVDALKSENIDFTVSEYLRDAIK